MEENNVDLFDYLRVIWKRKILIIVVTLVCIGVGVGVMNLKPKQKLPVTYRAVAVVKIGKKVQLVLSSGISSSVVGNIENPGNLAESIPLNYDYKIEDGSGYHLYAERIGNLSMLRLNLKGPDKGVEKVLKEIVDMLVDEHRIMVKDSVVAYKNFMNKLEIDAKNLKREIVALDVSIKEMKSKEGEYLVSIESSRSTKEEGASGGYRSAFLNMLYLKTIDKERDLNDSRADLRNIQKELIMHKITLGNLEEYRTEMVGGIKSTAVEPNEMRKSAKHKIMLAGFIGLIMSLFIAFFMEYIEESKSKRNKNGKADLA